MTLATDWFSASIMLAAGIALGTLFLWTVAKPAVPRRKARPADDDALVLADLRARRDDLIARLREMDDDVAVDPSERTRLEIEAAQAMRELDRRESTPHVATASTTVAAAAVVDDAKRHDRRDNAAMRGFLWGAGSIGALAFLGFFVWSSAKDRGANQGVTGDVPMSPGQPAQQAQQSAAAAPNPQSDAELRTALAAVQQNPENLDAHVLLARIYIEREDFMNVFKETQFVLQRQPKNARALTYQGLVRLAMGQGPQALDMLKSAVAIEPDLSDAWVGLAWTYTTMGRKDDAVAAIGEASRRHPDQKERLDQLLAQMGERVAGGGGGEAAGQTGGGSPQMAGNGGGGPMESAPMGGAPASAAGPSVKITIDLAPAAKSRVSSAATLFVFARAVGATSGPPIAAKRLAASQFPMTVELSSADSMMGQQLPPNVRIEARLDADGNPLTRDESDPKAAAESVAVGSNVTLKLQ